MQNNAPCARHQQEVMCHGQQQRVHDVNHRDHLTYLRSRRQPSAAPPKPSQPCYPSHMFTGPGPTYADQVGRVWPIPKSGTLGGPQLAWPLPPSHTGPAPTSKSTRKKHYTGQQPIYRSRSDETLSTVSSHAAGHHHRRHEKHCIRTSDRPGHRTADPSHSRRDRVIVDEPCLPASDPISVPSTEPLPVDEPACQVAAKEHVAEPVEPVPLKSTFTDSNSNPDSGYSGTSCAAVRQLARCSETSSLHSASSGDVASNPAIGSSSVRSESVPSICNSLWHIS